jgi:predicted O-linked N-acetylglucosamine transferase (SPINDLY family)
MESVSQAFAMAMAEHQAGRLGAAEQIYRRILAADPQHADALHLLGVIAHQVGNHAGAVSYISQAIQRDSAKATYHNNLGEAYRALGRFSEAIPCYQQAVRLEPQFAGFHYNLGLTYKDAWQLWEAVACYQRALQLQPDHVQAHNNLGNAFQAQGLIAEAVACFREALQLKPDYRIAHSNLVYALHFCADYDARALFNEHRRWNERHAQQLDRLAAPHTNNRRPDRRLRVGYVSPDWRDHPVGRFMLPLLEAHDHAYFEIICYSSVRAPDAITVRCRALADGWRDVGPLPDAELAQLIRQDRIDVLVDLTMHMAGSRLLTFARRPAPVQVTYLAYCGTTGLQAIGYRLTDPYLDPPGSPEDIYSEHSIRLPETYWCYQPVMAASAVTPLPALKADHVTFGCLNSFCKVSAPTLATWGSLLRALPHARLLVHAPPGRPRDWALQELARQDVGPERVTFVGLVPTADYFGLYEQMDVALDPFPYGGGTTTCDALWMGVPVVSLAGQTGVGRGGLSILSNIGLAELVAENTEDYVRVAGELASDRPRLSALRATLRDRMQASPLMDASRFARNVEAAYRGMWASWCSEKE